MGVISLEKLDHLYWLGRYTERVYTTLRKFYHIYDEMIEEPEGVYKKYCEALDIPNIYVSNNHFVMSYLFDSKNPDSLYANMNRAYDNAIVLREELCSDVLAYIQLALYAFDDNKNSTAPLLELQTVIDYIRAFWGCMDDYVESEDCRNIIKCGKYIERLDLYLRLGYHLNDLDKEFSKLINRLNKTNLHCNQDNLDKLKDLIAKKMNHPEEMEGRDMEILALLGGLIEVR